MIFQNLLPPVKIITHEITDPETLGKSNNLLGVKEIEGSKTIQDSSDEAVLPQEVKLGHMAKNQESF